MIHKAPGDHSKIREHTGFSWIGQYNIKYSNSHNAPIHNLQLKKSSVLFKEIISDHLSSDWL